MTSLSRRRFNRSLLAVPVAALVGSRLGALTPTAASAAPADWNAQVLAGLASGGLMHQVRAGDGTWNPSWTPVEAQGTLYRVSCVGVSTDLHVVASLNSGAPSHAVRSGADGSWTEFTRIPSLSGPTTGAVHIAVTALDGELHVFGASENGTTLYHTVRAADGTWQPSWTAVRNFGTISHLATTRVGTTIDTAVVAGGKLLHAIRSSTGTWTGWGNIETSAGAIPNDVFGLTLAGIGAQLHVYAVSGSSEVHHAIRKGDGTWQRFSKVAAFANYSPIAISAANVGGETQVGIVDFTADATQVIRHAIRRTDGTWTKVGTVRTTGLTGAPGTLALTGTL